MNIKEEIQRYLALAMGNRERSFIKDKVKALGEPIFDHVLKITIFGNIDQSWIDDTLNWLYQIHDLYFDNNKKKRLPAKEYKEELFTSGNWAHKYKLKIRVLENSTGRKSRFLPKDWETLYKLHDEVYTLIATELTKKHPDFDKVERRLELLGKDF